MSFLSGSCLPLGHRAATRLSQWGMNSWFQCTHPDAFLSGLQAGEPYLRSSDTDNKRRARRGDKHRNTGEGRLGATAECGKGHHA